MLDLKKFFQSFQSSQQQEQFSNSIHEKLKQYLPNADDQELITLSCVSGLMARVAHCNLKIDQKEIQGITVALKRYSHLNENQCRIVAQLALDEVVQFCGVENYKYCSPLIDFFDEDQRYGLLEALFMVAASDDNVDQMETEEIRTIAKALGMNHHRFISARATVIEFWKQN